MRGSIELLLAAPSLSMFHVIEGDLPVHRFPRLFALLVPLLDAYALAVSRWMDEIDFWHAIVFGDEYDRETRNHNPWAMDAFDYAGAFGAGVGE